jgi:hypothetical protein
MTGAAESSKVQLATTDGTVAIYDTATNNGAIEDLSINALGLYEYVKNDSGVITKLDAAGTTNTLSAKHDEKTSSIEINSTTYYLNSSTIVVFYGGTWQHYNAVSAPVTVITGYSNIPDIAVGTSVTYVANAKNANVIDVLYVAAAAGTLNAVPDLAYIADAAATVGVETINGVATDVYTYTAYVNGVETPLKTTSSTPIVAGLFSYTTTNGYVTLTAATSAPYDYDHSDVVSYVEGSYVVAGTSTYNVSSTTKFYQVDATKKTVTEAELALVSGKTVTITYAVPNAAGTGYDAIYFTVS